MRSSIRGALLLAALWTNAVTASPDKIEPALWSALLAGGDAEFLVQVGPQADLAAARLLPARADRGRYVVATLKQHAAATQAGVLATLREAGATPRSYWLANAVGARGGRALVEALAQRPEVERIHPVVAQRIALPQREIAAAKADEDAVEPSLALVGAPDVWALGYRGQGVVVGDHDIGVVWDHPALKAAYRGWDGEVADHDYNWRNAFPEDPFCTDLAVPCDSHGHGTHTTGTMVGDGGAGNRVGMAPQAQWIACRSLLDPVVGVGTVPTYLDCMEWMVAPYPIGDSAGADPARAPHVINNSWGCVEACPHVLLQAANAAIKAAGIVQVVSAGNDGSNCMTIQFAPAMYADSFTVGSTTVEDAMSGFSSRGPVLIDASMRVKPDIVAPGSSIRSSWNDGDYATISGTSMASPHVAGLVALILSARPDLIGEVDAVIALIQAAALPIVTTQVCGGTGADVIPNNIFGHGRIDALAAVQAALGGAPEPPPVDAAPPPVAAPAATDGDFGGAMSLLALLMFGGAWRARRGRK